MTYIVRDEKKNGNGDIFETEFDTLAEAIKDARCEWSHLTREERQKRSITVVTVDENGDTDTIEFDAETDSIAAANKNRYSVRFADSGEIVDIFDSIEKCKEAIERMERVDKRDGVFEPGFYEIYDHIEQEIAVDRYAFSRAVKAAKE